MKSKVLKPLKLENHHFIVGLVVIFVLVGLIYLGYQNYQEKNMVQTEEGLEDYHRNFIY